MEELENNFEEEEEEEFPFTDSPPDDTDTNLDRYEEVDPELAQRNWTGFQPSSSNLFEPDRRKSLKRKYGQPEDEGEDAVSDILIKTKAQRKY